MTKNRQLIMEIINASEKHLSAQEIYELARERQPGIAMATVYNNLNALVDAGVFRRVKLYNGPDRIDKSMMPHEHMICECCGNLWDMPGGDMTEVLEARLGRKITGYELNVHFVCKECESESAILCR